MALELFSILLQSFSNRPFTSLNVTSSLEIGGTIIGLHSGVNFKRHNFTKYVVCTKCNSLYNYDDCHQKRGSVVTSTKCSFKQFQNSSLCNNQLLKSVELSSGKKLLYPYKVYCYGGLKNSLERLLQRPGFTSLCERWRTKRRISDVYCDIHDGRIWRKFQHMEGIPFLTLAYNYALMLNIDWFLLLNIQFIQLLLYI